MRASLLAFAFVAVVSPQVAAAQQLLGHVYGGGGPVSESDCNFMDCGLERCHQAVRNKGER